MLESSTGRRRTAAVKSVAVIAAVALLGVLLSFVGSTPASAAGKYDIGGKNTYADDGSPAAGTKVDLFSARDEWTRDAWLGEAFSAGNGRWQRVVDPGCYITVAVAPLGTSFDANDSGKVYDQVHTCIVDEAVLNVDRLLYREAVKPPPTTVPPTTTTTVAPPPTTVPPTTTTTVAPPPTTVPPTTTTTVAPTTTTTVKECVAVERKAYWNQWGKGFSWSGYPSELGLSEFSGVDLTPVFRALDQIGTRTHSQAGVDTHTGLINILVYYDRTNNNSVDLPTQIELVFNDGEKKKVHACFHVRLTMSPIGLDTDGSGAVERVDANVEFDFAANGEAETVSEWFAPTEGILFDASIEGPITGQHLFGDQAGLYADGFEKLGLLDTNADGQVAGAELDGLAIWTDVNTNGVLDAGEQSSLADHGVVSLSTSHTSMVSSATLADGSTMVTEDLWFPEAGPVSGTNTTSLVLLGLGGLSLLGYAVIVSRRRRDSLDTELQELLNQQDSVQ